MIIGVSGYQPIVSLHVLRHTNILIGISLEIVVQPHLLIIQNYTVSPHILPATTVKANHEQISHLSH